MIPLQFHPRAAAWRLDSLPPLSLYIHFPWCVRKCPYCDFNSHEPRSALDQDGYIDALIADLESALPLIWGRRVQTVFMGGGTPSLFSPAHIDRLLRALDARLKLNPDAEITLEANPGTLEIAQFAGYRAAGVNRLSIGVQSFDPGHLSALGRIHGADEARRAAEQASRHFDTFNLDIMYALPGQTLEQALADVEQALALGARHLSAYHLTLEPNTLFAARPPANLPDDDLAADMQEAIEARLAAAGFVHYETSAFALPGHQARHNLNYWTFGDYLGIGAGAHGKLSFHDRIQRDMRHKQPAAYLAGVAQGSQVQTSQPVAHADLAFEFMMNALRLTEGFALSLFNERTGLPLSAILPALEQAQTRGWVQRDGDWLRPTLAGQRFLNDLLGLFLPDQD
ncbi:radical SAM family heme chaperone HemW [Rivihabitans pingtungensis]|jgi:oxygen-independent coproporphyrinogen-3 oxidase|uniref:radical SAM family heme chaperone HemW n=1 Tax=Rivihabitans pingtungensis TaxID=1054498 RepID=UPI002C603C33|nr:radical SAM family heme chaperone HemW [Rivihabitans pingtungensis]HNX72396.1 radical SAM family heme chaperone HemW [Rivihabitans pingtungensis]